MPEDNSETGQPVLVDIPRILTVEPAHLVEICDADEEIFDIYSRLATAPSELPVNPSGVEKPSRMPQTRSGALGFVDSESPTIVIQLEISQPQVSSSTPRCYSTSSREKRKPKSKSPKAPKTIDIQAEIHQDLFATKHRSGDTGSIVWRASIDLAELLWYDLVYPRQTAEGLLSRLLNMDLLTNSTRVLELGVGTGCLAILCDSMFPSTSTSCWTLSDQFSQLPIISKNLSHNKLLHSTDIHSPHRRMIEEVDWLVVEQQWLKAHSGNSNPSRNATSQSEYDLIIAVDCLYNESLILPLLRTIDYFAKSKSPERSSATLVLLVSELRSNEVMASFIGSWLEFPLWKVYRIDPESLRVELNINLSRSHYVVWCGWKINPH